MPGKDFGMFIIFTVSGGQPAGRRTILFRVYRRILRLYSDNRSYSRNTRDAATVIAFLYTNLIVLWTSTLVLFQFRYRLSDKSAHSVWGKREVTNLQEELLCLGEQEERPAPSRLECFRTVVELGYSVLHASTSFFAKHFQVPRLDVNLPFSLCRCPRGSLAGTWDGASSVSSEEVSSASVSKTQWTASFLLYKDS